MEKGREERRKKDAAFEDKAVGKMRQSEEESEGREAGTEMTKALLQERLSFFTISLLTICDIRLAAALDKALIIPR